MLVILSVVMTLLVVFFLITIRREDQQEAVNFIIAKAWNYHFLRLDIEAKKEKFLQENEKYHQYSEKKVRKKVKEWDKQILDYQKKEEAYLSAKVFSLIDAFSLFGYRMLQKFAVNAENEVFRKLAASCEVSGYLELERGQETGEQKNSFLYANYLLASLISYAYLGVVAAVFLAILMLSMGRALNNALVFAFAGFGGMLLMGYLPYDTLNVKAKEREEAIEREFPDIISKIALLVTAGMNIVNAIEEAAKSSDGVMYLELQKAVKEMKQSVSVEAALVHLQCRCNNKYLDKLVTIVSKSYVAGNANLADNLRTINAECWLDKKHGARRMSERVQNKLFVPTMLMFVGILVVIIVPAMSGMNF